MENLSHGRVNVNNALIPVNASPDPDTQNKIHKHLVDINDIITDDDIRRIKIDVPNYIPAPKQTRNKRRKQN